MNLQRRFQFGIELFIYIYILKFEALNIESLKKWDFWGGGFLCEGKKFKEKDGHVSMVILIFVFSLVIVLICIERMINFDLKF